MEAFLKKEEYNYINKRLKDLNNALRTCNDYRTRDASRDYIQDKILSHLSHLLPEQKKITRYHGSQRFPRHRYLSKPITTLHFYKPTDYSE